MPHHFHENEENEAHQTASARGTTTLETVVPSTEPTAPRYDARTVREIIALAEQMQTRHRETLSATDIESLGRDVGVEPEFIWRAIAQKEAEARVASAVLPARKTVRRERDLLSGRALSRRQMAAGLFPAGLYLLLLLFTTPFGWVGIDAPSNAVVCNFVLLPAFLALCLGVKTKSKRVSALGGGLLGFVVAFALFVVNALGFHQLPPLMAFLPVFAVLTASGAALGIISAGICQIVSPPRFKRVRLILETDETGKTTSALE